MATKYELKLSNLVSLNWKKLLKSKSFWLGLAIVVFGIYTKQYEIILGGAAVITVRDALTK